MSTRSITSVRSRWGVEKHAVHAHVYRHHDGYLEGQGQWLFEFLDGLALVNGIGGNMPAKWANGPGRLAAQLVAALQKDDHSPDILGNDGNVPDVGQEFHYVIDIDHGMNGGTIAVVVFDGPVTFFGGGGEECKNEIFRGTVAEYGAFLKAKVEADK